MRVFKAISPYFDPFNASAWGKILYVITTFSNNCSIIYVCKNTGTEKVTNRWKMVENWNHHFSASSRKETIKIILRHGTTIDDDTVAYFKAIES